MKAFGIAAALATAIQAVALIMLHLLPMGYNPVRDAVSDYGVGPYRGWFWLQAVTGGVGCLALAIALAQLHPFTPAQAVVALVITGGARFLIPFFATDRHGSRFQTLHGINHMILTVIAFGGLVWAATDLWPTLNHYPAWHGAEGPLARLSPRTMRVPRTGPVPGSRAQLPTQPIEQRRGHQRNPGDRDRSREADKLDRQLEQGRADSADHDHGGHAGHSPLNHVARRCTHAGQAGQPCRLRVVPDDDGSHVASPVTCCAQPVRRPGRPDRPGLPRSPTRSA